jgi:hypothetical protein
MRIRLRGVADVWYVVAEDAVGESEVGSGTIGHVRYDLIVIEYVVVLLE